MGKCIRRWLNSESKFIERVVFLPRGHGHARVTWRSPRRQSNTKQSQCHLQAPVCLAG